MCTYVHTLFFWPYKFWKQLFSSILKSLKIKTTASFSSSEDKVTVHFVNRDGETLTAKGKVGDSLLDVVIENNLDIDGFGEYETFLKMYKWNH